MISFKIFPKNIIAAVSEKNDGAMKDSSANRRAFFSKLGLEEKRVVSGHLVHGNNITVVSAKDRGKKIKRTDGLITANKNILLSVTIADCLPILLYDPIMNIIGIVHAGWRGLEKEIPKAALEKFAELGSKPSDILAAIGPGIGQCHFEVQKDVADKFSIYPETILKPDRKIFIDLKAIAEIQLLGQGLREKNIEINPDCTFDYPDKYFSFRRDKPETIQAMTAVIGMS